MTGIPREEAIKYFEDMKKGIFLFNGNWLFDMAIEALKQELILDKIRAEIEQIHTDEHIMFKNRNRTFTCVRLDDVLQIIDKYKESEK